MVLVTKSSATRCRSWEDGPEHICAINHTHSNIVKFKLHDEEYDKALQKLEGLTQRALAAQNQIPTNASGLIQVEQRLW